MPAIPAHSKVLVTGANGYIALWIVRSLLERGYAVRAAVRTQDKGEHLKKLFNQYGDNFEIVIVEDITKEGAFDEAVKGVDAIEHTASPLPVDDPNPDVYIVPAVKGTLGVLDSAKKHGVNVKRVVYTSSLAAVLQPSLISASGSFQIFKPDDWNNESPTTVTNEGEKAAMIDKYRASKTLAERSAWDFVDKYRSKISWDFVALHPPLVIGPSLQSIETPESFTSSMKAFYDYVLKPGFQPNEAILRAAGCWVDVRDVANAHVRAIEIDEAGGQRFITSAGQYTWQEWIDVANSLSKRPLQKGIPGLDKEYKYNCDAETTKRVLGIEFRTKEETVRDVLESIKELKLA